MNRVLVSWSVILLLLAIGMIVSPIPLLGAEQFTPLVEIGVFILPVAIVVAFAGGLSPDPELLTIGGALGNPDENALRGSARRPEASHGSPRPISPKQPVNCRKCYTLVAWDELYCARCRTPRSCRPCGGSLEWASGSIECQRCRRPEVYCHCPSTGRPAPVSEHTRRRAMR